MVFTNRLAHESSPYLRQHAHNPVDWYPWGGEAFERAVREDRPVFLSIGYSTCHWCHVMEHESFDNETIADFLNTHFVSIKLDREQRPDLDDIYMTGVQMLTGQGGWPMSSFLTPDGKPFFAGTYYPPENFLALLRQIAAAWRERREEVDRQASEVAHNIGLFTGAKAEAVAIGKGIVSRAREELLGRFDDASGGFGGAPKFPNEPMLMALLEDWSRSRDDRSRQALTLTLDRMYQGGIHDQVAGGFHRYTVDDAWLVPHFEKMLYNQAQLVRVYARAASLFDSDDYRRVVHHIVEYLVRDMRSPAGTFYSATDADSEGEEGRFFVWTPDELEDVLGKADAEFVSQRFGVSVQGNFEGRNILHLSDRLEPDLYARVDDIRRRLYEARETRMRPLRDEKVIAAWNGLLASGLALAGMDLDEPGYIALAEQCIDALIERSWDPATGEIWRIDFENERSITGNLEDYAFVAEAALILYRVTGSGRWLTVGLALLKQVRERFADTTDGGFYLSLAEDDGPLITRPKSPMDGAMPSGNSAALHALVLAWEATGDSSCEADINSAVSAFGGLLDKSPSAFSFMVCGIERFLSGPVDRIQFAAGGRIRVTLSAVAGGHKLQIAIAPSWHINGPVLTDSTLMPTTIEAGDARVDWPSGEVFEGEVEVGITGQLTDLALTLQPCSGDLCLAPQTLRFVVG